MSRNSNMALHLTIGESKLDPFPREVLGNHVFLCTLVVKGLQEVAMGALHPEAVTLVVVVHPRMLPQKHPPQLPPLFQRVELNQGLFQRKFLRCGQVRTNICADYSEMGN